MSPSRSASSALRSELQSSTRILTSTTSGSAATVRCSVRSALNAGITTAIRFPLITQPPCPAFVRPHHGRRPSGPRRRLRVCARFVLSGVRLPPRDDSPPATAAAQQRARGQFRADASSVPLATHRLRIVDCKEPTVGGTASERIVPRPGLDRDPAQLGERVDRRLAAEAAVARRLHAAERHLRLVVHRRAVDVADARTRSACATLERPRDVAR